MDDGCQDQLLLQVDGTAGTGKTYLIKHRRFYSTFSGVVKPSAISTGRFLVFVSFHCVSVFHMWSMWNVRRTFSECSAHISEPLESKVLVRKRFGCAGTSCRWPGNTLRSKMPLAIAQSTRKWCAVHPLARPPSTSLDAHSTTPFSCGGLWVAPSVSYHARLTLKAMCIVHTRTLPSKVAHYV